MFASNSPIQKNILAWYFKEKRDLPWRITTDPYKILVSEIMLQQTQVDRVIPKYNSFLKQFPTTKSLAEAQTADVLKSWSGLGFNRRALRLQDISKKINALKKFPETEKELLQLKGIGPYTASAVCSFAYNQNVAVLDTNIRRVFHRIFFKENNKQNETLTKELELIAEKLLPHGQSRDWHNALMDLGATICTAQTPKCSQCPVASQCQFEKIIKTKTKEEQETLFALTRIKNKQGTFKNSNRFYRGRILDYLRKEETVEQQTLLKEFKEKYQKDISFILIELEKDKLIAIKKVTISLPN